MEISDCPICGYSRSQFINETELRNSFNICDCCGCEYGYDDTPAYRKGWLDRGAP